MTRMRVPMSCGLDFLLRFGSGSCKELPLGEGGKR